MTFWLLITLLPPVWFFIHTVLGLLFLLPYGCSNWKIDTRGIHVVARRPIWFGPAAQTHGAVIYYQNQALSEHEALVSHEFIHVQQSLLFGAFYPATYALWFLAAYTLVKLRLSWWERRSVSDVWHAYRTIPWERWAYSENKRHG